MVIGVFALLVLVAVGGFFAYLIADDDDPPRRPTLAGPTLPDITAAPGLPEITAPSYSPPALPSYTPYSPPYSPPVRLHYGAIAVAGDGSTGKAWDYGTRAGAERRALNECPRSNCKVLTTFVNGCGAIAFNSATNRYWGGHGSTRTAAQRNAISNAGGGRTITWVCTTRPG